MNFLRVLFHGVEFSLACWVYEHYAIVRLPWDSSWTWLIAFILVDFTYYWFHRAVHGNTIVCTWRILYFVMLFQKLTFCGVYIKYITVPNIIIYQPLSGMQPLILVGMVT